jgi:nicotinate-nucleotide adenylyltransferase
MRKSVAIYGGSFDPPHISHVLATVYALKVGGFDRVLVVPVFEHAFQKQLTPFSDRVQMCELSFSGIEGVEVSTVESALPTPSLTLNTLLHLTRANPDWDLRLLIGSDVLGDTSKWHAFERISQLAPPFVVGRPGFEHSSAQAAQLPDISSTSIRHALNARGNAESEGLLAACLPRAVLRYIREHDLYGGGLAP